MFKLITPAFAAILTLSTMSAEAEMRCPNLDELAFTIQGFPAKTKEGKTLGGTFDLTPNFAKYTSVPTTEGSTECVWNGPNGEKLTWIPM